MAQEVKSREVAIRSQSLVKLPATVCEECGLDSKGSMVQVLWGKNYRCVVIVPVGTKLGRLQVERINNLCNEPLDVER